MTDSARSIRVAGFWARCAAGLVDFLVALLVSGLVFWFWCVLLAVSLPDFRGGLFDALLQIPFEPDPMVRPGMGLAGLAGLATVFFQTAYRKATIGQSLLGLEVVGPEGAAVGWTRAAVRTLALGFSVAYLFLGVFWIGFDRFKQGWHDKLAGTYVVVKGGSHESGDLVIVHSRS